jgi:hypothetical protein
LQEAHLLCALGGARGRRAEALLPRLAGAVELGGACRRRDPRDGSAADALGAQLVLDASCAELPRERASA